MSAPLVSWFIFAGVVFSLLIVDLGVFNRKAREIPLKESLTMSAMYIFIACAFGIFVWRVKGGAAADDYFTSYIIEKMLSLDNIFVMSVVFQYFNIPKEHQHRVLFWGILAVPIMRGALIGAGIVAVDSFSFFLDVLAVFLIYTGFKMFFVADKDEIDIAKNPVLLFFRARYRITEALHGKRFFIRQSDPKQGNKQALWMTPLFVTLVVIECADVIFALDSVPAVLGVTTVPFIVFTSNIFAILGLRAMYFALSALLHRFEYLNYSLSLTLIFIGGRVLADDFLLASDIPSWISLAVTGTLIGGGILFSLYKTKDKKA